VSGRKEWINVSNCRVRVGVLSPCCRSARLVEGESLGAVEESRG
jgi:hypothetical protein